MKVYFNNTCKICKAEIDLYKKEKIKEIDWIDITSNKLAEKETSKSDKELLRRLHVVENEKVIEGAEAFLVLWKKMPKYKFLYNFFKLPIIFNLFSVAYEIIAFFLYLKNKKQLKN
jgi:predicted DCC family thiol-disulfide oxidoreductase YuxK|tara:strand:+ start:300 stop:647 length:348 start_codon:yes stop_codon:yes gene_type:complete